MDRDSSRTPDGRVTLVLSGDGGTVIVEAWTDEDGTSRGVLGIHRAPVTLDEEDIRGCGVLPGGMCRPDVSYSWGAELAPEILEGYETRAWTEMLQFYRSHVEGES